MVLWCALAWPQVLSVDVAEPWMIGDVHILPSFSTTAAVDSNPQWVAREPETSLVLGVRPAVDVTSDTTRTLVDVSVSAALMDVAGNAPRLVDRWAVADAAADVELFRDRPAGVQASFRSALRTQGGARDLLEHPPSFSTDVALGGVIRSGTNLSVRANGLLRNGNYQYRTPAGLLTPFNYSDEVGARTTVTVNLSEAVRVGAQGRVTQHAWGASSIGWPAGTAPDLFVRREVLRPIASLWTDLEKGHWTFHVEAGWDGTRVGEEPGQRLALGAPNRVVGEVELARESERLRCSVRAVRFNDRPMVADLSVVSAVVLAAEGEVAPMVRVGATGGLRSDELLARQTWRSTRVNGGVYSTVDLSPNLSTTVAVDGSRRDQDPFERLPITRLAATVQLTAAL